MKTPSILSRTALLVAASLAPMAAQTPLYNDGTAFGGSRVFSEGLNPLGNPARFSAPPQGWYMTYVDGDRRSKDNTSILEDTISQDPATVSAALARLKTSPWALRTRAYGLAGVNASMNFGFSREEFNSLLAYPDLDPAHLGSAAALGANTSFGDNRRVIVDRVNVGGSSVSNGFNAGYNVRVERWELGVAGPSVGQNGGLLPFPSLDALAMGFKSTSAKTTTFSLDAGFTAQLAQGLSLGVMADQINAKRLWDVNMKPQFRAALQLDLGLSTQLILESDLKAVQRMPFPVNQQTSSASLRYQVSEAVLFKVGGERKKIDDQSITSLGATLQLRTRSFLVSFGFQAGQDRPLKGFALMVN